MTSLASARARRRAEWFWQIGAFLGLVAILRILALLADPVVIHRRSFDLRLAMPWSTLSYAYAVTGTAGVPMLPVAASEPRIGDRS